MPRALLPLFATAAVLVAVAAGCGEGEDAVAVVDGTTITREQLEETVEHFEEESQRENRAFPEEGTPARRRVERRLLELLVDRAQLEAAARRLGVVVDDEAVERRLEAAGAEEGEAKAEAEGEFARSTVRAQLVLERVAQRLRRGIRVDGDDVRAHYDAHPELYGQTTFARVAPAIRSELLQVKRNRALQAWIERARRVEAARTEIRGDADK